MAIAFVLALLGTAVVCFVLELLPVDVVGLLLVAALLLARSIGVIPADDLSVGDVLGGFANPALITIAALFVMSAGLTRTGAVAFLGQAVVRIARGREIVVVAATMITVAVCSAFVNNTPLVVIFLPVLLGIAHRHDMSPSRLLIPLSYAAIVGGTCTLVGTSTNLLVSEIAEEHGLAPLGMFEFTRLGAVFLVLGIGYMLVVGRRLLPERRTVTSPMPGGQRSEYLTELEILPGSRLDGRRLGDTRLRSRQDFRILQVIVDEEIRWNPSEDHVVQAGDVYLVKGATGRLLSALRGGVQLVSELRPPEGEKASERELALAELVLPPGSPLLGRSARAIGFRRRFGVEVLAIQRRGSHLRRQIMDVPLLVGDMLLVQATASRLADLGRREEFLMLEGTQESVTHTHRAPVALAILAAFVALVTTGALPIVTLALLAGAAMVVTRVLSPRTVYREIDWPVLVLIAGTLALGRAMEATGAARFLAEGLVGAVGVLGPVGVISAIYLVTNLLTEAMSNSATAVLMAPIAISTAGALGVDPRPLVFAVAFAASASFATPIGYQTNTFVYGPGGYRFLDYVRVGLPLNLLFWATATFLIPILYA